MLPNNANINTYGGKKKNARPVRNPETDLLADEFNELINDASGMTMVTHRAIVHVNADGTINWHGTVWGDSDSLKPTVGHALVGVYTVTYLASIVDQLGKTRGFAVRSAEAYVQNTTSQAQARSAWTGNAIEVRTYNSAGALGNLPFTLRVW